MLAPDLAAPICSLINTSIRQGFVPRQWKLSRITLVPKVNQVKDLKRDVRPISITCPISKVAECFIDRFVEEHFYDSLDLNQFGNTKGRSTLTALILLTHTLFNYSDDSHNFVRVLFVDFSRAFELIDHTVLADKLSLYNFPPHLKLWMLSFLYGRSQFVKVGNNCSKIVSTHAGAPQGTRAGPSAFKIIINDFKLTLPTIKYVDDVSVVSVASDPGNLDLQNALHELYDWSILNGLTINTDKTKEMLIHFGKGRSLTTLSCLMIDGKPIDRVENFKVLGIIVSSDLTWNAHVAYIVSKACRRLYIIYQLLRSGVSCSDIIAVYCSLIRSVLEYCCPVWHCGLTDSLTADIECVQKRVLRLIFPHLTYAEALLISGLDRLSTRRQTLSRKAFNQIKSATHVLNHLLVPRVVNGDQMKMRTKYPYVIPRLKTDRAARSVIWHGLKNRW